MHTILFPNKVFSCNAKIMFYDNFYEQLNLVVITIWLLCCYEIYIITSSTEITNNKQKHIGCQLALGSPTPFWFSGDKCKLLIFDHKTYHDHSLLFVSLIPFDLHFVFSQASTCGPHRGCHLVSPIPFPYCVLPQASACGLRRVCHLLFLVLVSSLKYSASLWVDCALVVSFLENTKCT